jgi:hypothetical protein
MNTLKLVINYTFVFIGLLFATLLSIFGQDISYYLNGQFPMITLSASITIITFISIGLYIFIPIYLFVFKKVKQKELLIACIALGSAMSMWSFLVWAMWMG